MVQSGITFEVDSVVQEKDPFPEDNQHAVLSRMLKRELEACSHPDSTVLAPKRFSYNALLFAVHEAYSHHRPLIITPDSVWITITQGVAYHMTYYAEDLRDRFVSHDGKMALTFDDPADLYITSRKRFWEKAISAWADMIQEHVHGDMHELFVCDFSTSGPLEKIVSKIVMMDVFQYYFKYVAYVICGIPTITLEGSPEDWERLAQKAATLRIFEMDWWLDHLLPICDQFVRASRGDIDLKHWQSICKLREEYGGNIINGWIAKLLPYLKEGDGRNPIFDTGEGFHIMQAPSGLSRFSATLMHKVTGREWYAEIVGGLTGVTQDAKTLSLRPVPGWAVYEVSEERKRVNKRDEARFLKEYFELHVLGAEEWIRRNLALQKDQQRDRVK